MFQIPTYFPKISWKLSEVLYKVGVNETYVSKRRTSYLLQENVRTLLSTNLDTEKPLLKAYHFGSSTEVSTTPELDSDIDLLICSQTWERVNSLADMTLKDGSFPYVLVEDKSTPPGYCQIHSDSFIILSVLSSITECDANTENAFATDMHGREILSNSLGFKVPLFLPVTEVRHGPATCAQKPGYHDADYVPAAHCSVWPKCGERFLDDLNNYDWPHEDIKNVALTEGCFLVPVGFSGSEKEQFEWRLSASLVERSLMFSLNITQIRCYVLLKMILKAFLKPIGGEAMSSFQCKNVLFRCIRASPRDWTEENLLKYVTLCLIHLRQCVSADRCPNFVFEESNLFAGKLSKHVQRSLENALLSLINGVGVWILDLPFDNISHLLKTSLSPMTQDIYRQRKAKSDSIYSGQVITLALNFQRALTDFFRRQRKTKHVEIAAMIRILEQLSKRSQRFVRLGAKLLLKMYTSYFASLVSSDDIIRKGKLSKNTVELCKLAIISSPLCSKLKLASTLYCTGDIEECRAQLSEIQMLLIPAQPVCGCSLKDELFLKSALMFRSSLAEHLFDSIVFSKYEVAHCIEFTRDEMYCVPEELRCELFRSTIEDRKDESKSWLESSVVDAESFFAFLSYLLLGKYLSSNIVPDWESMGYVRYQQLKSLFRLKECTKYNYGHRETAYNILGQCYEKEGCLLSALDCYRQSLLLMNRNNAAKFHVCRVLWLIFNQGIDSVNLFEQLFTIQAKQAEKNKTTGFMQFGTFEDSTRIEV